MSGRRRRTLCDLADVLNFTFESISVKAFISKPVLQKKKACLFRGRPFNLGKSLFD
jgi:hypothetical protein